jgi:hypothetical protein
VVSRLFRDLVSMPVTHVWRGGGSALFLEFGTLTPRVRSDGNTGNARGEVTLMIEWSWRIEAQKEILCGSWSDVNSWPAIFETLKGATVQAIDTFGALPEISVTLSNGLRVASFMTADGQPAWSLIDRRLRVSAHVLNGDVVVESVDS